MAARGDLSTMAATPRVDVLMPVFNAGAMLAETMDSILSQTFGDFRLLAVDDGSTDGSRDRLEAYARADGRVVVLAKANGGIVDALNHGLSFARAEFVARHDADDISCPERFARQVEHFERHPDCVAVSASARQIDERGRTVGWAVMSRPEVNDPHALPSKEAYLMHPFLMVRRWALERVGGYRHVIHSEDTDLYWRLLEVGALHNMDAYLGDYRIHAASISSASIVNGRVAAISSQLAALSHRRRLAGLDDIVFHAGGRLRLQGARELEPMLAVASEGLAREEADYLGLAARAKLLELSSYRPFRLEPQDFDAVFSRIEAALPGLEPGRQRNLRWLMSEAQALMLRRGDLRNFLRITPLANYPRTVAKAVLKPLKPRTLLRPRPLRAA